MAKIKNISPQPLTLVPAQDYREGEPITLGMGEEREISGQEFYLLLADLEKLARIGFIEILEWPSGTAQEEPLILTTKSKPRVQGFTQ